MRISDWSSDVCSSDLRDLLGGQFDRRPRRARPCAAGGAVLLALDACARAADAARLAISEARLAGAAGALAARAAARRAGYRGVQHPALYRLADDDGRSEERRGGTECVSTF